MWIDLPPEYARHQPCPPFDGLVVLMHDAAVPITETHIQLAAGRRRDIRCRLTADQSATLLRDRHVSFVRPDVPILGIVAAHSPWYERGEATPAFEEAVHRRLADGGLPVLATVPHEHLLIPARQERPITVLDSPDAPTTGWLMSAARAIGNAAGLALSSPESSTPTA